MMHKNFAKSVICFAAVMLLAVTSSFGLSKTSDGVYQIGSCTDLIVFSRLDGNASFNAELTASFDMSEKYTGKDSTCNSMFKGVASSYAATFNGNGYSISNLVYDDGGSHIQNMGLFNTITTNAVIENVVLENLYIKANGSLTTSGEPVSVGGIVGWMPFGTIQNCYVSGTIETTGEKNGVGGIVGYMDGGTVQDCLSAVNISASNDSTCVGGIAGYATTFQSTAIIERCVYDGTSLNNAGDGPVGGLVGSSIGADKGSSYQQKEGTLSSCYYVTSVTTNGVGSNTSAAGVTGVTDLNTPEVACVLNKGEWDAESETCSVTNGVWGNGLRLSNTGVSSNDDGEVVYTITFNANHGTFPDGAKTQKYLTLGTHITADEITNPTLTDSTLIGWSYDSTATTPDEDLGYVSKVDTVYAIWHTQEKVTFIANTINQDGAKFSNEKDSCEKSVDYGATITAEDVETPKDFNIESGENKTYYAFLGWSLNESATTPDASLGIAEGPVTVYAVWKETAAVFYTVTFDVNGHGSAPLAQRIESGDKATAPTDLSAEGFTFDGWYSNSYGTGAAFDFGNTAITSDITVYAKWSAITYNITYHNVDNASNGSNPAIYTALSDDITLQKPDSTGYTFGGWYYDEALTNPATTIASGSTGNKDFYAKWTETTYTITFAAGSNGKGTVTGNAGTDKSVKKYNEDLVLPTSGYSPRSSNTKQAGWNYTDGASVCDIPFAENGDTYYTKNADATLYPCWTGLKSYTITYTLHFVDANGKSIADSVKTESFNETQTHAMLKPADLGLDVPGYTFGGWTSVTNVKTNKAISYTNDKFTMPSANVSIVGTSTLDTYTITYNNLDRETDTNATQYTVLSNTIKLVAPYDSANYAFVGWYDNAQFTGDAVTTIAKGSTGDKTLYAKWRRTNYGSVKISADGKTVYVEDDTTSIELTDEGIEVENIVFERSGLQPGIVATVVLPFDLPEGSSVNAKFYTFNYIEANVSANKWVAHFKKQTTLPVADVPYVFILNSDADSLRFTVNGKAVVHAGTIQNKTSPTGDWTFIGTYEYHQWTKDDPDLDLVYGFSAYTDENIGQGKFGKAAVDCDILPTRAYLKKKDANVVLAKPSASYSSSSVVRKTSSSLPAEIDVSFDDENGEVMAIGKMNTVTGQVKINRWVDLKGRSSLKKPTAKGVYFNKKLF